MAIMKCSQERRTKEDTEPRVYSYLRFSTPEQAKGDSERRQEEGARAYADKIGMPFDETLRMTDRGLSGYHGAHRKKGTLGRFLKAVDSGEVPKGSILVVENLDRLGREEVVDALETIVFGLIKNDITIYTFSPERTYDRESLNGGQIFELIVHVQRAHAESKRKSDLGQASWQQKRKMAREEHRILTRAVPAWLAVTEGGHIEPIPEAVKAVRMIFDYKLRGLGKEKIATRLNAEAPWSPPPREKAKRERSEAGNGWRASYVQKILSSRAVLGEYQPFNGHGSADRKPSGEPIQNYFPPIIDPSVFAAVEEIRRENAGRGGRTGKARNLFVHLAKCAYCGAPMAYMDKGSPPRGNRYLVCNKARRGLGCRYAAVRYDECEKAVLENCHKLRPEQVLPNPDEQESECQTLRQQLAISKAALRNIDEQRDNFLDQVGRTKRVEIRDDYEAKIAKLDETKPAFEKQINECEKELKRAEAGLQSFAKWKGDLQTLQKGIAEDPELRLRLRAHLREIIERIEVFSLGYAEEYDPDELGRRLRGLERKQRTLEKVEYFATVDSFSEEAESLVQECDPTFIKQNRKQFYAFLRHVTERRMSREGRFFRIRFKTGVGINVVPLGSLASGEKLIHQGKEKGNWCFVSPDMEELWREFQEGK